MRRQARLNLNPSNDDRLRALAQERDLPLGRVAIAVGVAVAVADAAHRLLPRSSIALIAAISAVRSLRQG